MNLVFAPRASTIIYDILAARNDHLPFLLPANVCPIVPITLMKAGRPFEFVDISPATLHMDLDAAADRLHRGGVDGLLYAHTYGEPSTPIDFFAEAKSANQPPLLIDDRCLCSPDIEPDGDNPADVILYSTGYAKVVDLGFGGYAFLKNNVPYKQHSLPFYREDLDALEREYKHAVASRQHMVYRDGAWLESGPGISDQDDYLARVASGLEMAQAHRMTLNAIYSARLPAELQLPLAYQGWRFHLRLPERDQVLRAIFAAGLFASSHYASLAGIMAPGSCLQAEILAGEVLNLFNDQHYSAEMAEKTCDIILKTIR